MSALDIRATLSWLRAAVVQELPALLLLAAGIILIAAVGNPFLGVAVMLLNLVSLIIREYRWEQRVLQARRELDRHIEAEAEALVDQTLMGELAVRDGHVSLDLVPPRELAAVWVHCARGMLGDAENYTETPVEMPSVSMEVGLAGEVERFALIVQRVGKLTPHEARRQAEAERDRSDARIAEALELIAVHDGPDAQFEHHWKWVQVSEALTGEADVNE